MTDEDHRQLYLHLNQQYFYSSLYIKNNTKNLFRILHLNLYISILYIIMNLVGVLSWISYLFEYYWHLYFSWMPKEITTLIPWNLSFPLTLDFLLYGHHICVEYFNNIQSSWRHLKPYNILYIQGNMNMYLRFQNVPKIFSPNT